MNYDFDNVPDRIGTFSYKWDSRGKEFPDNPEVIPMWVADTDFPCPREIVESIVERAQHPIYAYSSLNPDSSKLVAGWQKKRHGWEIDPSWVTYSSGVVPAINRAVLAFTEKKDGIIIQSPVYYPFKNTVVGDDRTLYENNLVYDGEKWVINYEELEEMASKDDVKLLIFCNPHNPVCRVFTEEELRRVGEICLKHHVLIFADEIHSDLVYKGYKHIPIASLSKEISNITVTAMAPSKTFNVAGLQTSTIIVENEELRNRFDMADAVFYIPNLFGAVALKAAYGSPGCADYVDELMEYLWENYQILEKGFQELTPLIHCQKPEATYLMWIDCRELGLTEEELWKFFVVDAGVGIEMGNVFGSIGKGFVRMNIGCTKATIKECIKHLGEVYKKRNF